MVMDNHFIHRFPRLFPSAFKLCQSRTEPDIILNPSTPITKTTQSPKPNGKSHKSFSRIPSDSHLNQMKKAKPIKSEANMKMKNSSSSHSGLFSSEETETFCSFSTASAESYRMMKLAENKNLIDRCSSQASMRSVGSIFAELSQKSYVVSENGCENRALFSENRALCSENRALSSENRAFSSENRALSSENRALSSENRAFSCENRACSKKIAKANDKLETQNGKFQEAYEVPGMPAELYYKRNKNRGVRKSTNSCGRKRRMKQGRNREGRRGENNGDIGLCSIVEKTSSDPYTDFRTSIVEMILENQIFGAQDLEKLLHCLVSLNSPYYHNIIVEVFSEICETLYAQ